MDGSLTLDAETQFLSTPSGWRATGLSAFPAHRSKNFYPRPPGGGRRPARFPPRLSKTISIHALRVEGDRRLRERADRVPEISIHALRVEGDFGRSTRRRQQSLISIHALRVEGDVRCPAHCSRRCISIHALRVEGDGKKGVGFIKDPSFLSTPSGWRATQQPNPHARANNFYPRPPGGGRRLCEACHNKTHPEFLSTPSGWRATTASRSTVLRNRYFYPRPPGGGRPHRAQRRRRDQPISIHALRVEGDLHSTGIS